MRERALALVVLSLSSLLLMASGCYTIEDDGTTTTLRFSQAFLLGLTMAWAIVGFVAALFTSVLVPQRHRSSSREGRLGLGSRTAKMGRTRDRARQRRRGVLVAIIAGVIGVGLNRGMRSESVVITPTAIRQPNMFILARAVTYATLFIGLVLIFVPARVLSWSGVCPPAHMGIWQGIGVIVGAAGAAVALSCVLTFAFVGRGTPAPFDPPRRLVVRGPYRFVRNPMYVGAVLALAGAALFYQSLALAGYTGLFLLTTHMFVVAYEERTLRRTFGDDYEAYCRDVRRWWPRNPT